MTEWSNLQWMLMGVTIVATLGSLGWNVGQARRLARLERREAQLVDEALHLVDELYDDVKAGVRAWDRFGPVKLELREAALLAQGWGALHLRWHGGQIQARPAHVSDPPADRR